MTTNDDVNAELATYLNAIGEILGSNTRKESFAVYVVGLMSSLTRKTVEGIAAMTCTDPSRMEARHQELLHVVGQAKWEDAPVRAFATKYALMNMGASTETTTWIIDDTGFPKQGSHSVGVQRQYSGTLGKVGNCQIGVSLVATHGSGQVPVDFALYLPEPWANDRERRRKAKIPDCVEFKTKPELAIDMMQRALGNEVPPPKAVLADSAYGNSAEFRHSLRGMGLRFGVGIQGSTSMWRADSGNRKRGPLTSAENFAAKAHFRRVTWGDGTKGPLTSRFAFFRVVVAQDAYLTDGKRGAMWLVVEKPDDNKEPIKYHLTDLPHVMSYRKIAWFLHQRYRTEQVYLEMKQELGLDHYEGRSFVGWHHHVTAAIVCYNFIAAQRSRLFSPDAKTNHHTSEDKAAA